MAVVNARTYQILYILRCRVVEDLPTRKEHFGTFIRERQKTAPALYGNAYLGPTATWDILQRMTHGDKPLLTVQKGEYSFTPQGSQMTDLLETLDACSTGFFEDYKALVILAALQQRLRMGFTTSEQGDLAGHAGFSLDSTRKGLRELRARGLVHEDGSGPRLLYSLLAGNTQAPSPPPVPLSDEKDDKSLLEGIQDGTPQPTVAKDGEVKTLLEGIQDGPPVVPIDPDTWVASLAEMTEQEQEEPQETPVKPDGMCGQACPGCCPDTGDEPDELLDQAWDNVPLPIQEALFCQAMAAGMSLVEYLDAMVQTNARRYRRVINGIGDQRR